MLKEKTIYLPLGILTILTMASGVILASEETGAESKTATVTVSSACTFSGTVDSTHAATMANGTYQSEIGTTTLNTVCNDANGYAVYAIGFSDNTFGNNKMIGTNGLLIASGTATSGGSSAWAMKVSAVPGATTPTIENGFDNYSVVPSEYTMVASEPGTTDVTVGSSIQTTYAVYVAGDQGAGTYTGKVKYSLVHPSTALKPSTAPAMQEYTLEQCQAEAVDNPVILSDARDNNEYSVRWIEGNCWMTQDLNFDLANNMPLTSDTSNVPERTSFRVQPLSAGETTKEARAGVRSGFGGYGYNFCAASAGTVCATPALDDIEYDICPKGWGIASSDQMQTIRSGVGALSLFQPISGDSWWTSTVGDSSRRVHVVYSSSSGFRIGVTYLSYALSIRCVKK